MQTYLGFKMIKATPMNRLEYVKYRGWELPADEDGNDEGYLVEYIGGGRPNHPDHEGYISWSPKAVFEDSYSRVDGESTGQKLVRTGFNPSGKGAIDMVKAVSGYLIDKVDLYGLDGRTKALAITNIEQGVMWAVKSMTVGK